MDRYTSQRHVMDIFSTLRHQQHIFDLRETTFGMSDCHILESTCYQHTKHNQRDITIAIPSVSLSICPPVSLSYSDVTSKRLNVSLKFVRRPISPVTLQCESKKSPPAACGFHMTFFDKRLRILHQFVTHLLHVPIYARLQIFIQLSQTLIKLCHIKSDYLVHVICSKCPPSAKTHAFRRLQKSLIALLIAICGKSSQICCFYNVNVGYDMTSTVTSFAQ